jgi:tRNA threonylcarbamoyladenosine biosynthesis protein TsaB
MALILHIETATGICSVALAKDGVLVSEKTLEEQREHARLLTVAIDDLMISAGFIYKDLDAVSVSKGPGSYTGLRIGVATAKGLCFALDIPLLAVSTLRSMADCAWIQWLNTGQTAGEKVLFCPMIDARRMEVYSAVYSRNLEEVGPVNALILEKGSFDRWKDHKLIFFGDGSEKYRTLINNDLDSYFMTDFQFSALGMIALSHQKLQNGKLEDPAYFEPFYLKDFVAGPKKSGSD